MRRAFVLQMSGNGQACFEGRVEHIDSGHARRFRSLHEFLDFIEQMQAERSDSGGEQEHLLSGLDETGGPNHRGGERYETANRHSIGHKAAS